MSLIGTESFYSHKIKLTLSVRISSINFNEQWGLGDENRTNWLKHDAFYNSLDIYFIWNWLAIELEMIFNR